MFAITVFIWFMLSVTRAKIDSSFTKDYFMQKNIAQIIVFGCETEYDIIAYCKHMMDANIRILYQTIRDNLDMKTTLKVNYYKIGVVLDMDCLQSETIFNQFSTAQLLFNESYTWLSITTSPDIPTTILSKLPLTVESELTLALVRKPAYLLYDVYNPSYRHGGRLNVTSMGHWDEKGLKNYLTQYKYKRRQDFRGMTLNLSISLLHYENRKEDLNTYISSKIDSHLDSFNRFHYGVVSHLRDIYNFKINLQQQKTWGYLINGTYNGILGDMINGITDISITPFQFFKDRLDVCKYTAITWVVKPYFIFRHPKKNVITNAFFKPFSTDVWWVVLNIGIISWILLMISIKVEEYYNRVKRSEFYSNVTSETALITVAAISQQGLNEGPHLFSGRIAFISLFLWALVMYQFYSASIVGSLLAPSPKFIKNKVDLANSELKILYENTPYIKNHFNTTTDPEDLYLHKKALKQKIYKIYIEAKEGIEMVKKGGYAFFIDSATAYKMIEDTFTQSEICELAEVELVTPRPLTIVTSKHSPFYKMIVYELRQMIQSGLINRDFKKWHHRKPSCPESFRSLPVPIEIKEFLPALVLMTVGLIIAMTIMSAEHVINLKFISR